MRRRVSTPFAHVSMSSIFSGPRWSARRKWLLVAAPAALFVACVSGDRISGLKPQDRAAFDLSKGGGVVISQVYGGGGNSGATYTNDFVELYNAGPADVDLAGWSVQYASAGGSTWKITRLSGTIASGSYYLVQEGAGAGGTVPLPSPDVLDTISMSSSAGKVALVQGTAAISGTGCPLPRPEIIDYVGYGTSTSSGANCFEGDAAAPTLSNTKSAIRHDSPDGKQDSNRNGADFTTGTPNPHPGGGTGSDGSGGSHGAITLSSSAKVPLVIGYQTVMFVDGTDKSGNPVDLRTITWSTSDPGIATVDARGLVTASGDGTAIITATAPDGTAGTFSLRTEVPFYSSSARTGHNTEFGVPADADASNDVIIARKQYTLSYNPQRGGPNWVSWDLSATHIGGSGRCDCYSADTTLARLGYGDYMYTTLNYTGSGYDRGHMQPSADQNKTDGENATTFFLTNFLPQQHGLNAGPWEAMEIALRDSVKAGREAYIIAGGIFTNGVGLGTLKNEGKIAIPDSTWKIVVMMPADEGLENVTSASDVNVFAVNMPNVANPGTNDWTQFLTSVDKIQTSTGYDFLSSLPEAIQCKVEQRNCAPVVNAFAGATILVGETYTASGTFTDASTDDWTGSASYGDGTVQPLAITGTTFSLSHRYTSAGTFTVTATVRDQLGAAGSASATVIVQSSLKGTQNLSAMLGAARLPNANSLQVKLDAAAKQLSNGNGMPAANQIAAFENELRAMVISGRVSPSAAAPLLAYAERVIDSIR